MELKLVICDDDRDMVTLLSGFCQEIERVKVAGTANSGKEVLQLIDKKEPQVVLLDIDLPDIKGIEVARQIKSKYPFIKIVFITIHNDFYQEAFSVYAFDYISKPTIPERLPKTLDMIKKELTETGKGTANKWVELTISKKKCLILVDHIIYIKSINRKLKFVTDDRKYEIYGNLKDWVKKLGADFYKCHRSYLVNINKIREVTGGRTSTSLIMTNGEKIPVSRSRRKELSRLLNCAVSIN